MHVCMCVWYVCVGEGEGGETSVVLLRIRTTKVCCVIEVHVLCKNP